MSKVKLELLVSPGSPQETMAYAREAEALGYARIGIWDSPALFREPWVILAAVAQATRTISLAVDVTNPLTRHPVVTASAAATLDELAPGRVHLGIGSGDSGVYNLGLTGSPIAHLREYVLTVRRLLEEGEAEYQGKRSILPWARRRIPIYISAHGSRAIRLAGEIGDGVIMGLGFSTDVVRGCLDVLEQGAREAGRDVKDIDIWWLGGPLIYSDPSEARHRNLGGFAMSAHHLARFTLEGKFIPDRYKAGIKKLGEAYDMATHGNIPQRQREYYDRLARELRVNEYLRERFSLAGTEDEVEEKLRPVVEAGARQFLVGRGNRESMRLVADFVRSRFPD